MDTGRKSFILSPNWIFLTLMVRDVLCMFDRPAGQAVLVHTKLG